MSQKDVIWLGACERLRQKGESETEIARNKVENLKFDILREQMMTIIKTLQDLRLINFKNLTFADTNEATNFINNLPSMKDRKDSQETTPRAIVTKRKPGEVPEWLRKIREERTRRKE